MRYLGIDYGERRMGLALCDPGETLVSPLCVVEGRERFIRAVTDLIRTDRIEALVIGLPINMDGSRGFQAQRVQAFADQLAREVAIPILFQDERLSSYAARERLGGLDLSRDKKRRLLDAVAAAQILEAFLEAKREGTRHSEQ